MEVSAWLFCFLLFLSLASAHTLHHRSSNGPTDTISAAVFFPNGTVVGVTINETAVLNAPPVSCPGVNLTALQEERVKTVFTWAARTNYNQTVLLDIYNTLGAPDLLPDGSISPYLHQFIVSGFASYSALTVAAEYALQAVTPDYVQLFTLADPASIVFQADNVSVLYKEITNYSLPVYPGSPTFDGFVNSMYMRFVPCTAQVQIDYANQDPLIELYLSQGQLTYPPDYVCSIIMSACTGVNQVYPDYASCLAYISGVANQTSPCPTGLIANSTACYNFHANSAVRLPQIHCPHVRPYNSPVCQDFCLTQGCGNCDENAQCVFVNQAGSIVPQYSCQCLEGFSGDGSKGNCKANTCTASWQCPFPSYTGSCTNGLCACNEGFSWNTTLGTTQACACSANETLQWYNGVAECIPLGRCRYAWQCPQSYNSITCAPYGTNVLIPYSTCLCNYGYDNPGFSYPCSCSPPKTVVWSTAQQGNVCLSPGQCVANYNCPSNHCQIEEGEWLGQCL